MSEEEKKKFAEDSLSSTVIRRVDPAKRDTIIDRPSVEESKLGSIRQTHVQKISESDPNDPRRSTIMRHPRESEATIDINLAEQV